MKQPKQITSIWDNEGETFDRYTFVLNWFEGPRGEIACLGTSLSGRGFSQFSYCDEGPHLGKRVKWSELSTELKSHVIGRLENDN